MAERAEFLSIPQCAPLPHEEKPEVVNRALLRFPEPWGVPGRQGGDALFRR
jgi:hypothetical protein